MRIPLVPIGNSRGIRIPKPLIDQCGLGDAVNLRMEHNRLLIEPDRKPRHGWELAFQSAASGAEDELLLGSAHTNRFDAEGWEW